MKQSRFIKFIFSISYAFGLVIQIHGDEMNVIRKESPNEFIRVAPSSFFQQNSEDLPKEFKRTLTPVTEDALKTGEYPRVVDVFTRWTRNTLKDEYIPSDAFIAENLQLLPAGEKGIEDRAVLSYRKGVNDYLIVKTGGPRQRLYIFIRGNNKSVMPQQQDVTRFIFDLVSQHIQVLAGAESPEIRIQEQGKLYHVKVGPVHVDENLMLLLEGVYSDGEVALSVRKGSGGPMRAWWPEPNRWFETENKTREDNIKVEKALAIEHSPENIAKQRKALEDGSWTNQLPRSSDTNTKRER